MRETHARCVRLGRSSKAIKTLNLVFRGHSESYISAPIESSYATSYRPLIVTRSVVNRFRYSVLRIFLCRDTLS